MILYMENKNWDLSGNQKFFFQLKLQVLSSKQPSAGCNEPAAACRLSNWMTFNGCSFWMPLGHRNYSTILTALHTDFAGEGSVARRQQTLETADLPTCWGAWEDLAKDLAQRCTTNQYGTVGHCMELYSSIICPRCNQLQAISCTTGTLLK